MKTGEKRRKVYWAIAIVCAYVSGCAGSPTVVETEIAEATNEDVFSLLEKGETEKVREMFRGTADVNNADVKGRTPLHIAVEKGNAELALLLIQAGAAVDAKNASGKTPIQIACEKADASCAAVLANAGADFFQKTTDGKRITDLLFADRELLRAIANKNNLAKQDTEKRTLLHEAGVKGDPDAAAILIAATGDLNGKDRAGKTALDLALERPDSYVHMKTAALLIGSGGGNSRTAVDYFVSATKSADLNLRFDEGFTATHIAAARGHSGVLEYLVEWKANVNARGNSGTTPLHEAIRAGRIKEASILLSAGADVNAKDGTGNTALHLVMPIDVRQNGIDLLLSKNIDVNAKDNHGDTALHIIVGANQGTNILSTIIRAGAEVNARNIEGKTPLHRAVEKERVEYVRLLVSNEADIFAVDKSKSTPFDAALKIGGDTLDSLITSSTVKRSDNSGNTQLHIAVAAKADISTLGAIIERKGAVNARNNEGNTALHIAVEVDSEAAGEFLLSKGADPLAMNSNGESPLRIAATKGLGWILTPETFTARDSQGNGILHYAALWNLWQHVGDIIGAAPIAGAVNAAEETALFPAVRSDSPRMIKALVENGVPPGRRDSAGNTLLHAAVRWNARNSIRALIESGFEIDARNASGKTALHDAVRLGIKESEELLTAAGATIDAYDNKGATPLMEAISGGNGPSVERLLELGASLSWRDSSGDTPLHLAVRGGSYGIITILLSRGASINAQNSASETPFTLALKSGKDLTRILLTKDRLNIADERGETPLHTAIREKATIEIIKDILELGALPTQFNSSGQTPLHSALAQGRIDAVRLLLDAGADIYASTGTVEAPIILMFNLPADKFASLLTAELARRKDKNGAALIHYAASKAPLEVIRILAEYAATSLNEADSMGQTPSDIAKRWNRSEDIMKLLAAR